MDTLAKCNFSNKRIIGVKLNGATLTDHKVFAISAVAKLQNPRIPLNKLGAFFS